MNILWEGIQTVKEYLFPVFCLSCQAEGSWVCDICMDKIGGHIQLFCPVCHVGTREGRVCEACRPATSLMRHVAMMKYQEDHLIGSLIHTLKYEYAEDTMHTIRTIIASFIQVYGEKFRDVDLIIPVPLHKKRFAERGFNQAGYIGNSLASELDISYDASILIRSRYTPHQATLQRNERMTNVEEAFTLLETTELSGKHILLVDDVYTTGATMQSCARVLLQGGAQRITGCSLARG